ncbi:hypothetical protein [Paraflavitalea sp. CAU 1676]|uniref:plasmid mobilization protein n=1 Tax=Paraflavitalea sp. CAU 1676 TaxID=3032598 RepID=UPI0023DCC605|nr:hypothetical protein [Paraflavitalea sp. CAU 1676]MDF2188677.1 hypothetical protein [Paraflavitalea sp. CAU 1676]
MKAEKVIMSRRINVRFTEEEYKKLLDRSAQTTCSSLSEYTRKLLLQKPVTVYHRNQSVDELIPQLVGLKNDLNAIANNYNQVVRKLHILQHVPDLKTWLPQHEIAIRILTVKADEIKALIAKISDAWLQ